MTQHDIFVTVLKACGWKVSLKGATHTYLLHPDDTVRVFVGKAGSLRYGTTLERSRPFIASVKLAMLDHYNRRLAPREASTGVL